MSLPVIMCVVDKYSTIISEYRNNIIMKVQSLYLDFTDYSFIKNLIWNAFNYDLSNQNHQMSFWFFFRCLLTILLFLCQCYQLVGSYIHWYDSSMTIYVGNWWRPHGWPREVMVGIAVTYLLFVIKVFISVKIVKKDRYIVHTMKLLQHVNSDENNDDSQQKFPFDRVMMDQVRSKLRPLIGIVRCMTQGCVFATFTFLTFPSILIAYKGALTIYTFVILGLWTLPPALICSEHTWRSSGLVVTMITISEVLKHSISRNKCSVPVLEPSKETEPSNELEPSNEVQLFNETEPFNELDHSNDIEQSRGTEPSTKTESSIETIEIERSYETRSSNKPGPSTQRTPDADRDMFLLHLERLVYLVSMIRKCNQFLKYVIGTDFIFTLSLITLGTFILISADFIVSYVAVISIVLSNWFMFAVIIIIPSQISSILEQESMRSLKESYLHDWTLEERIRINRTINGFYYNNSFSCFNFIPKIHYFLIFTIVLEILAWILLLIYTYR